MTKRKPERAAERQVKKMAAEIIAIADDAAGDYVERENAKGQVHTVFDRDNIARAKLRIDTRMWLMARLAPHIYGTPSAAKPGSGHTPEPISVTIDLGPLDDDADVEEGLAADALTERPA